MKRTTTAAGDAAIITGIAVCLTLFGLLMLASAGVAYGDTRFDHGYFFVIRQAVGAGIGVVGLLLARRVDYHVYQRLALPGFAVAIVLMLCVFVPGLGQTVYGATRWVAFGSFSFQPSEVLKICMVLFLAAWCARRSVAALRDPYEGLLPFLVLLGALGALIVLQPDVGTLGVVVLTATAVYFTAGARLTHLAGLALAGLAVVMLLIHAEPYRLNRLLVFLHPETDPQGIGYQVSQALIAVGSGGPIGRGIGHSMQKFNYLPEPVGDSIFAVIAEEIGFLGSAAVVVVFAALAYYGYRTAMRAPDTFGRLVAVGITTWITVQAAINIGAVTALIPLTGIPLPFISFGSTSLVVLLASVGILCNIAQQGRE